MGSISQQLEAYADELESGRWRQIRDRFEDGEGGKCGSAVWFAAGGSSTDFLIIQPLVVDEVHRIVPASSKRHSIATLNDDARIPFSMFAQAARTVAWRERLKEQERTYGAPIGIAEDADRLVAV